MRGEMHSIALSRFIATVVKKTMIPKTKSYDRRPQNTKTKTRDQENEDSKTRTEDPEKKDTSVSQLLNPENATKNDYYTLVSPARF